MLKLNIGSGRKRIEGFTNVDALEWDGNTDIRADLSEFPWDFETESVDEILMVEFLEHLSFRYTEKILDECHRILKRGGKLHIQVPDVREMMFDYWNGQICPCVPHKPKDVKDAKAKLNCEICEGYGKVHPDRWLYAFLGAQKHEYDLHRNIFTPERMEDYLLGAGFNKFTIGSDEYGWKLKVNCEK